MLALQTHGSLFWFIGLTSTWVSLLSFANPPVFDVNLPPFYVSLLCAWRLAAGSASPSGVLYVGRGVVGAQVSAITTKSTYLMLLADHAVSPHCEEKFFPVFGAPSTWHQLFLFDIEHCH